MILCGLERGIELVAPQRRKVTEQHGAIAFRGRSGPRVDRRRDPARTGLDHRAHAGQSLRAAGERDIGGHDDELGDEPGAGSRFDRVERDGDREVLAECEPGLAARHWLDRHDDRPTRRGVHASILDGR